MNSLDLGKSYLTHDKIPTNGAWSGPGAEFFKFWDHLHIFGSGKARVLDTLKKPSI